MANGSLDQKTTTTNDKPPLKKTRPLKPLRRRRWVTVERLLGSEAVGSTVSPPLPEPPFPSVVGDRKQIPLVRGQLVAYSCPSTMSTRASFFRGTSQPPLSGKRIHYRSGTRGGRKWWLFSRRVLQDTLCRGITRRIPADKLPDGSVCVVPVAR